MIKTKLKFLIILAVILTLTAAPLSQALAQQSAVTMRMRAGFDSYCQSGAWMPVRITIENNGPDLEGQIVVPMSDTYTNAEHKYVYPIQLPSGSRKEVTIFINPPNYMNSLKAFLIAGGKEVVSTTEAVDCLTGVDMLYGVLAGSQSAYTILNDLDPASGRGTVAQLDLGDIPEQSRGLEALDLILISDFDTGAFTQKQRETLTEWVSAGGFLVVTGGLSWQKTAAGVQDLLPFLPNGAGGEAKIGALADFAGLDLYPQDPVLISGGTTLPGAATLKDESGNVLAAWHTYGSGSVYYLTVDPSLDPLRGWDGMLDIYRTLLAVSPDQAGWSTGFKEWYYASEAASSLPGLSLPSVFLICGFLAAYVAVIGPINYIILVKLKKRELAWISIPLVVLFFSGCALIIGLFNRGGGAVLNRVAVVRSYQGSETAQVDGVVGLYSPSRSTFNLRLGEGLLTHPMPETYSMGSQNWTISTGTDAISLPRLQVDVGAVKMFVVEGVVDAPRFSHTLRIVTQAGGLLLLEGSITNDSGVDLADVILMMPGRTFRIGGFQAGDTIQISERLDRAERAPDQEHQFFFSNPSSNPTTGYGYYYYGTDTTINDLVGNYSYYDNPVYYRRYAIASALFNDPSGYSSGRGGGIVLAGWAEDSPLVIEQENNRRFNTIDTTLYLINLKPELPVSGESIVLAPPMFVWKMIESSTYSDMTPYDGYITRGLYAFRYSLAQPVNYTNVDSLTLHIECTLASSPANLKVSLWDFANQTYERLDISSFGDIQVPHPQDFVGPGGEIILQIDSSNLSMDIQLNRADFTLVVEP